jgi:putative Mg2+ transporter-C (MgtC) family protein
MTLLPMDIIKLLVALFLGGLIGAEREYRDKAAGFRTIILICVGAALFTIYGLKLSGTGDPARVAANIVSGVGFLGAGAILRDTGRVVGLTTAATIWLAAAVGMGVGAGEFLLTGAGVALILLVLWVFPVLGRRIDNLRHVRRYEVICPLSREIYGEIEQIFLDARLKIVDSLRTKSGDRLVCTWRVNGSPREHEAIIEQLIEHSGVLEFKA